MPQLLKPTIGAGVVTLLLAAPASSFPPRGDWAAPMRLDAVPGADPALTQGFVTGCAALSRDTLTLYFTSNRDGDFDLFTATRSDRAAPFTNVTKMPAPLNVANSNDSCPSVGPGNSLYFTSTRGGDAWGDLYRTKRTGKGWTTPANLGAAINGPGLDETPTFFTDRLGRDIMIFAYRPPGNPFPGPGTLMQSVDGGPATPVAGSPNAGPSNNRPSISKDGKVMHFDRPGPAGGLDIFRVERSDNLADWGPAVPVAALNSAGSELRPYLSADGAMVTFSSTRGGDSAIWFSTRPKTNRRLVTP